MLQIQIRQVFLNKETMPRSNSSHLTQYFDRYRHARVDAAEGAQTKLLARRLAALQKASKNE
jgi:hypothetical protein